MDNTKTYRPDEFKDKEISMISHHYLVNNSPEIDFLT
jgi:hypothetical protein